jgi:hypothetical protein
MTILQEKIERHAVVNQDGRHTFKAFDTDEWMDVGADYEERQESYAADEAFVIAQTLLTLDNKAVVRIAAVLNRL